LPEQICRTFEEKLVPGAHPYHALAEAAANAAREGKIAPGDIAAIVVSRPGWTKLPGPLHPDDLISMAHSPAFFIAAAAHDKLLLLLVALMLTVLVVAHAVLRRGLLPLRALQDGVARLGRGELDVAVETRARDEFGALTAAFNGMAARIRERAFVTRTMPPANKTGITDAERALLGAWAANPR